MMSLLLTAGRKVGFFLAVLLGVSFAIILLGRMVPGDAIDQLGDDPEFRAAMMAELGLDKGIFEQYVDWVGRAITGEFGQSWVIRQGESVANLIGPAFKKTLFLLVPSLGLTFLMAALLLRFFQYDGLSYLKAPIRWVVHIASVLPLFVLGEMLILGLNHETYALMEAGTLSRPGWFALPGEDHWFKYLLAIFVLALGNGTLSDLMLHLGEEVDKVRHREFILSSWARGAKVMRHLVHNLLVPVATIVTNKTTFMLGGVVVVEWVFNINGVGAMIWRAANARDIPVVIAISFLIAGGVVLLQLLSDLLQVAVDPRARS